jgi:hypothetical protein
MAVPPIFSNHKGENQSPTHATTRLPMSHSPRQLARTASDISLSVSSNSNRSKNTRADQGKWRSAFPRSNANIKQPTMTPPKLHSPRRLRETGGLTFSVSNRSNSSKVHTRELTRESDIRLPQEHREHQAPPNTAPKLFTLAVSFEGSRGVTFYVSNSSNGSKEN